MKWLILALCLVLPNLTYADPIRLAVYNVGLSRKGPGLLLRDIVSGKDKEVTAVVQIIAEVRPDILLVMGFDNDADSLALSAFQDLLQENGLQLEHAFAPMQNAGVPSGFDLNGDGRLGGPADALGYGLFRGQGQMALLSRFPIDVQASKDFSGLLWRDFEGADLPTHSDTSAFPSEEAQSVMRLSSKAHWVVPISTPDGRVNILASHHSPPVFDGPEDMNGKRNADELKFWLRYLDETSLAPVILLAGLNADPMDGDGPHVLVHQLLNHPRLQDPKPTSAGGTETADKTHVGDPATDTVSWQYSNGPGNLRVDYVLPDANLTVKSSGVFWPIESDPKFDWVKAAGTSHRLVWADVELR